MKFFQYYIGIFLLTSGTSGGVIFASENISPLRFEYELLLESETKISLSNTQNCEQLKDQKLFSSPEKKFWKEESFSLSFDQQPEKCVISFLTPYMSNFSLQEKKENPISDIQIMHEDGKISIKSFHIDFEDQSSFDQLDVKKVLQENAPEIPNTLLDIKSTSLSGAIKIQSLPDQNSLIFSGTEISITPQEADWNGIIQAPITQEITAEKIYITLPEENAPLLFSDNTDLQPIINLVIPQYDCKKNTCAVSMENTDNTMQIIPEVSVETKGENSILSFHSPQLADMEVTKTDAPENREILLPKANNTIISAPQKTESIAIASKSSGGGGGGSYSYIIPQSENAPPDENDTNEENNEEDNKNELAEEKQFFIDVEDEHWAKPYISQLFENDIIKGRSERIFEPDSSITRAEFIKIALLSRFTAEYIGKCANTKFTDIEATEWYFSYVCKAEEIGVVQGYEDGNFFPHLPITRAEAVKIIFEVQEISPQIDRNFLFPDIKDTDWFTPYVSHGKKEGIITGRQDGNFHPHEKLLRSEATKLISELF